MKKTGRPLAISKEVITKLEQAFLIGLSDEEACLFAEISTSTLYNHQKRSPEFAKRKEYLRKNPTMRAKITIYKNLDRPDIAKWYLERKCREEFAPAPVSDRDEASDFVKAMINAANESINTTTR